MVRKAPDGHIKASDLIERFKDKGIRIDAKKYSKNELVWMAEDKGLVTKEERDASLVRKNCTIPCYLLTHVKNEEVLSILDRYVLEYSMMQTRGSFIANLIVQNIVADYNLDESFPQTLYQVPQILTNENEIKKCFLPERWILKNLQIDLSIQECLETHGAILEPFKSTTYRELMCDSGWDNALNHLGTSYLGNVSVQFQSTLKSSLRNFIEECSFQQATSKEVVWKIFCNRSHPTTAIHNDDYERLINWRTFCGVESVRESLYDVDFYNEINSKSWTVYCWLNKKKQATDSKASLLPVSSIGRKFAYLDWKITSNLLPKSYVKQKLQENSTQDGSDIQKVFDLTRELFNKTRQNVRKQLKKKWQKLGRGCMPKKSLVRSISTDGVGLRICLEKIPERPYINNQEFQIDEDTLLAANDGGRAKMATTVDNRGRVNHLTRKGYYYHLKDSRQKKYVEAQMQSTAWGTANNALAGSGGFKNASTQTWVTALTVLGHHLETIKTFQLYSKDQAFRRMKALRRKKAYFDQRLKNIIRPDKNHKGTIVFATGDEMIPSTGKGEKAVPTVALYAALRRIIRLLQLSRRLGIVLIPEFNTTKCCHKCGKVMLKLTTAHGQECLRYRLCINCNNETIDKRRNRDVNAAKNILKLLQCFLNGLERPEALKIPSWYWKRTTPTWVTPIC